MTISAQALASATAVRLYGGARERRKLGAVDLTYYRLGERGGEPWVLLHGLGLSVASWMPLFSELRPSCRMLLPELRSSAARTARAPASTLNRAPISSRS